LIAELEKVRQPYNLCTPSQKLATLALGELSEELRQICQGVVAERGALASELVEMPGVDLTPSDANFLWIKTALPAEQVFEGLRERGVLVRSFHTMGGRLANQLRITVGTEEENARFIQALRETLG
jgi:histidinol-phosphate aminotransferase